MRFKVAIKFDDEKLVRTVNFLKRNDVVVNDNVRIANIISNNTGDFENLIYVLTCKTSWFNYLRNKNIMFMKKNTDKLKYLYK